MKNDPGQLHNLADDPEYKEIRRSLAKRLTNYLEAHNDPRMQGKNPWDDYPFTDKRIFNHPDWKTHGFPAPLPE